MSPESARPEPAGTSMPGCHRSRSFAPSAPAVAQGERLEHAEDLVDPVGSRWWTASSRIGEVQRGRQRAAQVWSGRASIFPVPQPARTAWSAAR